MNATDTRSQLLAEIAARPGDDTLRLAFADWLDEHGDRPDDAGRAEFIRLDVERHRRWPDFARVREADRPTTYSDWERLAAVEKRLLELGTAHPEWSRCLCPRCGGKGTTETDYYGLHGERRRVVTCPTCSGTGDLFLRHVDDRTHATEPRTVTFARGFADAVHCTLADAFAPDGTPTAWALAVVRETPAVRFVLADTTPFHRNAADGSPFGSGLVWDWSSAHVPDFLMREMAASHPDNVAGTPGRDVWWVEFETEAEALDALALAAGRVARRHAYPGRK